MPRKNKPGYFIILAVFAIVALSNCKKKESDIGLDVQPPGDRIPLYCTDTINIFAYTVSEDSLTSYSNSLNIAGSYIDPVFGLVSSSFLTQFRLSTSNVVFDKTGDGTLTADSIVLYLDISGYYADTNYQQHLHVYKLNQDIYDDSTYYSDIDINQYCDIANDEIGYKSFKPYPHGTPVSITLDVSYANEILLTDSSNLSDNTAFLSLFKGLCISTEDASVSGTGGIIYYDLLSDDSKVVLYYHDSQDDSLSYVFVINNNCARINSFKHDYSASPIASAIDNPAYQDSILYIQGLGGVKTKIVFPNISSWRTISNITINKAELVVPVETDDATATTYNYKKPNRLAVRALKETGGTELIIDDPAYNTNYEYFNGYLDSTNNTYNLIITRYFQYLLQGQYSDYGLYIFPFNKRVEANRVVIGNTNNSNNLKLIVTYTKF